MNPSGTSRNRNAQRLAGLFGLLLAIQVPLAISQQSSSANYTLGATSIDAGVDAMSSAGYVLRASVGPPAIGMSASANYVISSGYWAMLAGPLPDVSPDAVSFGPQLVNVIPGSTQTSAPVTVAGLGGTAPVLVTGGSYSVNGGAFTTAPGTVANGDTLRVQLAAAGTASTTSTASLTIGTGIVSFSVMTGSVVPATRPSLSAGAYHNAAVLEDGSLWTWGGTNGYGQIGNPLVALGAYAIRPLQVGTETDWRAVAVGAEHMLAVKMDGTVWAWGRNNGRQLGLGSNTADQPVPVQVPGLTNVVALAAGHLHSLALGTDGTLWAWGYSNYGQIGDGTTATHTSPVQIGTAGEWSAIAAHWDHSVARKADGTLWAWGFGEYGQLGQATETLTHSSPVQVGTASDWDTAVAAGFHHSIALKADGTVRAWGSNGVGAVGDGTLDNRLVPSVVAGLSGVVAVTGGGGHTLALGGDGRLWAWGRNDDGEIGDGTRTRRLTPVQVGSASNWRAVAAGGAHSIALDADGTLWAWGANWGLTLGDGATSCCQSPRSSPHVIARPGAIHTITASATAGGSITPAGATQHADGATASFTIAPDPGYHLAYLRIDGVMTSTQAGSTSLSLANLVADRSVEAVFGLDGLAAGSDAFDGTTLGTQWTVVSQNPASRVTLGDGALTVSASPLEGGSWVGYLAPRVLQRVSGDWTVETRLTADTTDSSWYDTSAGIMLCYADEPVMTAQSCSLLAEKAYYWIENPKSLRVIGARVAWTDPVAYMRITKAGDTLTGWTSPDGVNWTESGTMTLTRVPAYIGVYSARTPNVREAEANARFDYFNLVQEGAVPWHHTITATASPGGAMQPSGALDFLPGSSVLYTITPDAGQRIAYLNVDGQILAGAASYGFANLAADQSIEAVFGPETGAGTSDAFDGAGLGNQWFIVNPNPDSSVLFGGGALTLRSSPANGGSDYDSLTNTQALRLLQPVAGDWTLETKVTFDAQFNYSGAGIMVCYDDEPVTSAVNCTRWTEKAFDPGAGGKALRAAGDFVAWPDPVAYMRLEKTGITYTGWISADGVSWTQSGAGTSTRTPAYAGLFSIRQPGDGSASYSEPQFDYFSVVAPDTSAPSVPAGLAATAVGTSRIDLSWNSASDDTGVTAYQVYRDSALIQSLAGSALAYSDTGLSASSTYVYTVAACDAADNCSAQSDSVAASTPAPAPAPDPTPTPVPDPTPDPAAAPGPAVITVAPGGTATVTDTTTEVNAGAGSTLNIVQGTEGATISLPAPSAAGGPVVEPVTIVSGGVSFQIMPLSGGATVSTTVVDVGGVSTTVLTVTAGTVQVTATSANQPLLALGTGVDAVLASLSGTGGTVIGSMDQTTGVTSLAVTAGSVTLPAGAFGSASGSPVIQDGRLYAGEVAVFDGTGQLTSVRLGGIAGTGTSASVGDPLTPTGVTGLTVDAVVPNLVGTPVRLASSQNFVDALVESLGAGFSSQGQNASGVLLISFTGGSVSALPVGHITVDTSRQDGMTYTDNGNVEVVRNGVVTTFAPGIGDIGQLAALVTGADGNAAITVQQNGLLRATLDGITYAVQPGWAVTQGVAGQAGFFTEQGRLIYRDSAGNQQILYPVFADITRLATVFRTLDPEVSVTGNGAGSATARFLGVTYTLTPDFTLTTVPANQAGSVWWQDGSKFYIRNRDGTAQGFSVQ